MTEHPHGSALWWADWLEDPDTHLGRVDRGLIAAHLRNACKVVESYDRENRRLSARCTDYQNRNRSLRVVLLDEIRRSEALAAELEERA